MHKNRIKKGKTKKNIPCKITLIVLIDDPSVTYLEKKKINFNKTQPGSIKYQDIVTHSNILIDKFTHYVIKDVELDEHILTLQEEINSLEKYIIEEMEIIIIQHINLIK